MTRHKDMPEEIWAVRDCFNAFEGSWDSEYEVAAGLNATKYIRSCEHQELQDAVRVLREALEFYAENKTVVEVSNYPESRSIDTHHNASSYAQEALKKTEGICDAE